MAELYYLQVRSESYWNDKAYGCGLAACRTCCSDVRVRVENLRPKWNASAVVQETTNDHICGPFGYAGLLHTRG